MTSDRSQGFSLIELILVLVVISVVVSLAVPRFRGSYEYLRFENTVKNFEKLIRYGQNQAVLHQTPYQIKIDAYKKQYWLERQKDKGKQFGRIASREGRAQRIPDPIKIKSDEKHYVFYPDGRSDTGKIVFEGRGQTKLTLILYARRGSIDIVQGDDKK